MCLLAHRFSKHETTGATPAELYLARDLRFPMDLLRGNPSSKRESNTTIDCVNRFRKKLEDLHELLEKEWISNLLKLKPGMIKKRGKYSLMLNRRFYNPRRKKGRAPKLQSSWEGPYFIVRKLNDVVYCICRSNRNKNKIVHADRLAHFVERKIN